MPTSLASYLPAFLLTRFRRNPKCYILRLPLDVHVFYIFIYLSIEDIICLRRTCKAFFLLTHEPIIWRRFLERMNIPIPPIRPSFRYSLQSTDYEIEQMVTRAVSVDDNWRKHKPIVYSRKLVLAHNKVLDMALVPGGKFLAVSMKYAGNYRYYITLFNLDYPTGPKAMARVPTIDKAYGLKAKYMSFRGRDGIMIAYARKRFEEIPGQNFDASDFSHRMDITLDIPNPTIYEAVCLHISLESLETLSDPEIVFDSEEYIRRAATQPPPFNQAAALETKHDIRKISLFDMNDTPYFAFILGSYEIVIINLPLQTFCTLICSRHDHYPHCLHEITAYRVIPNQREILVTRTITLPPDQNNDVYYVYLVEIYDLPSQNGVIEITCKDRYVLKDKPEENIYRFYPSVEISDYELPKTSGDQPRLLPEAGPPPPISLYYQSSLPTAIVHHALYPSRTLVPATPTTESYWKYFYNLDHAYHESTLLSFPHTSYVLAGASRSVLYNVVSGTIKNAHTIVNLRRYIDPERREPGYFDPPSYDPNLIMRKRRPKIPEEPLASLGQKDFLKAVNQQGGVAAISYDESIGRICIAAEDENCIRVLDCAQMVQPDFRFAQWKRSQAFLHGGNF